MPPKNDRAEEEQLLTDVELELMTILWKLGEGSVNDVLKHLSVGRELAYTSVSTILRILEQKAMLKIRKEGRGHIYIPMLKKSEYEARALKNMVDKVFDGAPTAMVKQLLSSQDVSAKELEEIRNLLKRMGPKK